MLETWRIPVLMYHQIADAGSEELARYRISRDYFAKHIAALRQEGFQTITAEALTGSSATETATTGRPILLTFDDGYENFATAAFPILQDAGFTAEVFLVTDLVGGRATWDEPDDVAAPLMNWSTIRTLARYGIAFGSHLATHTSMNHLSDDEIIYEAKRSRAAIVEHVGQRPGSIAAPFGALSPRHGALLAAAGYDRAFGVRFGFVCPDDDPFDLCRIEIHEGLEMSRLFRWLR